MGRRLVGVPSPLVWSLFPSLVEASPSLVEAPPPHRLGFIHYCSSLLHHIRCPLSTHPPPAPSAPPFLHLTQPPPFSILPPPTTTIDALPSTFEVRFHHQSTGPPSLLHLVHCKPTAAAPVFTPPPPPPTHRLSLCHLVGVSSLSDDFFLPPLTRHQSPTTMFSSPAERRPPPEPPPPDRETTMEETISLPSPKQPLAALPAADLGPKRPPPKPPDVDSSFRYGSVALGASVNSFLWELMLCLVCFKSVLEMFVEKPQMSLALWYHTVRADPNEANTMLCIPSSYHLTSVHGFNLDIFETTYSRIELEEDKELIRNWIVIKTVVSHLPYVFDRMWKNLIGWMLGYRFWLEKAPWFSEHTMCNVDYDVVGLTVRFGSEMWMGMPQHNLFVLTFALATE